MTLSFLTTTSLEELGSPVATVVRTVWRVCEGSVALPVIGGERTLTTQMGFDRIEVAAPIVGRWRNRGFKWGSGGGRKRHTCERGGRDRLERRERYFAVLLGAEEECTALFKAAREGLSAGASGVFAGKEADKR